jgi:gamma-glutamylputrescine oxidase
VGADWGTPPWRIDVAVTPAPLPPRCEVAVVGAGLTGLSVAYHLARAGVRSVVLEAGRIGAGASGRTGGIALEGTAIGPLADVERCLDTLRRVAGEAEIADLRLDGCRELVHQQGPGPLAPLWHDGDGSLCVAGVVAGGTVDPGALLAGLARAAEQAGATIHEGRAVLGLEPGAPAAVRTDTGVLHADQVVLALNAYTGRLLPLPVAPAAALTLALATAPLDAGTLDAIGLDARLPFYTSDLPYLWGRTLADGRLVVGAGLVFPADGDVRTVDLHGPEAAAALARLEHRLRRLHPLLADVPVAHRWGGPIAFLPNRAPLLGRHPDRPGVIVTGGYAGHGIALGVRIGELVAAAVTDRRPLPAWGALAA